MPSTIFSLPTSNSEPPQAVEYLSGLVGPLVPPPGHGDVGGMLLRISVSEVGGGLVQLPPAAGRREKEGREGTATNGVSVYISP